jgi:CDP-diacylglycerol--serine O-phosphatidyltransferase
LNITKNIPNTITLGNLLCGCLAIIKAFEGNLVWAAYFVGIALVLDFFDGFTARLLKVASPIGKDLDSLADMVTFGVVPGIVMYHLLRQSIIDPCMLDLVWAATEFPGCFVAYFGLIISIFSCIRLAKFNNDTRQSDSFIGLPTPANAMVICSIPLILEFQPNAVPFLMNLYLLCLMSCIMSLLLIAEIPLFALKFKGFSWADSQNRLRFVFLGIAVILLATLHFVAVPLIILLYILLSIVNNLFLKSKK